jgi:quinol monooxygenase YgiN
MIVARFKVHCVSDKTQEVLQAMRAVVAPSRALPRVIHFDVAQDVTDADALIALEVFEDRAALERQEEQPEVAAVLRLVAAGALTRAPEWTIYEVESASSPPV